MRQKTLFHLLLTVVLGIAFTTPAVLNAQDRGEGPLVKEEPKGITVDEIIQRFAAKEKEFKLAREKYTYRQTIKVQTLDGDTVDGEYQIVFDVLFDNKGRRIENVVFAPQTSLQRIQLTPQDEHDFRNQLPFVLTSDELPEYSVLYVGQQKQDELHTYVFDIAPKQIEKNKRYFQGRIWVDDHDFQIVKTRGKTVPEIRSKKEENLFPAFTTYREQIDGRYWFPTYTRADDTLKFSGGDVRVREIIRYTNYKRFGSDVKITYEGQELEKTQNQQPQQPAPTQPQTSGPPPKK
ncbi:MAG TPA: hypothetical protein VD837_13395 [Terriglobales bacterium]|nr:hypothetical protein [Terriglobales bacterium]